MKDKVLFDFCIQVAGEVLNHETATEFKSGIYRVAYIPIIKSPDGSVYNGIARVNHTSGRAECSADIKKRTIYVRAYLLLWSFKKYELGGSDLDIDVEAIRIMIENGVSPNMDESKDLLDLMAGVNDRFPSYENRQRLQFIKEFTQTNETINQLSNT